MNANKMLLHSYSAAFHAALLHVTKPISKHVRSATCVNAEEIAQHKVEKKAKHNLEIILWKQIPSHTTVTPKCLLSSGVKIPLVFVG